MAEHFEARLEVQRYKGLVRVLWACFAFVGLICPMRFLAYARRGNSRDLILALGQLVLLGVFGLVYVLAKRKALQSAVRVFLVATLCFLVLAVMANPGRGGVYVLPLIFLFAMMVLCLLAAVLMEPRAASRWGLMLCVVYLVWMVFYVTRGAAAGVPPVMKLFFSVLPPAILALEVWLLRVLTVPLYGLLEESEASRALLEKSREEVERARLEAVAANEAKGLFLVHMSHDIRTPLSAIMGYSELLQEELEERGEQELGEEAGRVLQASEHILELLNEFLDLAKVESGKVELEVKNFALGPVLSSLSAIVGGLASQRGNRFVLEVEEGVETLKADQLRFRQCLLNLLGNACKFTRDGTIALRVKSGEDGVVRFVVSDTGAGMSEEQVAMVFEPYWQASQREKGRTAGTGLGMAITDRLWRLMGGEIKVESAPGVGTTFTLLLHQKD